MKTKVFSALILGCLMTVACFSQTAVILAPIPVFQSFLQNGKPNAFGCVFTYASQTTTPIPSWTDFTGITKNHNPVVLQAGGTANIWIQAGISYTLVIKSSGGVNCVSGSTISTVNGIGGGGSVQTTAVTWSSTPTFIDTAQNQLFTITLQGNTASLPLSVVGIVPPGYITFQITQDGSGGHTFAWPANVIGGCTIGANADQVTTQMFIWNGTNATAIGPCVTGNGPNIAAGNISATGLTLNGFTVPIVLFKSSSRVTHTGDTSLDTIYTIPVPVQQINSVLDVYAAVEISSQAAGGGSELEFRLGGTLMGQQAITSTMGSAFTVHMRIKNLNSLSAQTVSFDVLSSNGSVVSGDSIATPTVNTGVTTSLVVSLTNQANSDSQFVDQLSVQNF